MEISSSDLSNLTLNGAAVEIQVIPEPSGVIFLGTGRSGLLAANFFATPIHSEDKGG